MGELRCDPFLGGLCLKALYSIHTLRLLHLKLLLLLLLVLLILLLLLWWWYLLRLLLLPVALILEVLLDSISHLGGDLCLLGVADVDKHWHSVQGVFSGGNEVTQLLLAVFITHELVSNDPVLRFLGNEKLHLDLFIFGHGM